MSDVPADNSRKGASIVLGSNDTFVCSWAEQQPVRLDLCETGGVITRLVLKIAVCGFFLNQCTLNRWMFAFKQLIGY